MNVILGFAQSPDHIFCTVKCEGSDRPLYSSLEDEKARTHQQNVEYYREIFALLHLRVPESMFIEVKRDRERRDAARCMVHDLDP